MSVALGIGITALSNIAGLAVLHNAFRTPKHSFTAPSTAIPKEHITLDSDYSGLI